MSVETPKFEPNSRLSLSVMLNFAVLSATREMPKKMPRGKILLPFPWETNSTLLRFEGNGATVPAGFVTEWRTVAR